MFNKNISFETALNNVKHFTTPYPKGKNKGKTPLEINEFGFTCFANSVKILQQYCDMEFHVPTKAKEAKTILDDMNKEN